MSLCFDAMKGQIMIVPLGKKNLGVKSQVLDMEGCVDLGLEDMVDTDYT